MIRSLRTLAALAALLAPLPAQTCPGCSVQPFGQGCGPTLNVELTANGGNTARLTVLVSQADPAAIGFMMWGRRQLDLPIPGTLCHIYTDYIWGHFFQISQDGTASLGHAWPNNNPGFFVIQVADIQRSGTQFEFPRLSNAVRVERQ